MLGDVITSELDIQLHALLTSYFILEIPTSVILLNGNSMDIFSVILQLAFLIVLTVNTALRTKGKSNS